MDADIFLGKKASIHRCLSRIDQEMTAEKSPLTNPTRMDAVVLNLQRACEMSIDLAMHAISTHKLGLPQTTRDAFQLLVNAGALTEELGLRLKRMVGFRNVAIHDYQALNPEILLLVLKEHLKDFDDYLTALETKWPFPKTE